jgi:hypothetical protein
VNFQDSILILVGKRCPPFSVSELHFQRRLRHRRITSVRASSPGRRISDDQNVRERPFALVRGRENDHMSACVGVAPASRRIFGTGQFRFRKFRKKVVASN